MDTKSAKTAALSLIKNFFRFDSTDQQSQIQSLGSAAELINHLEPLPDSRKGPSGEPLDLLAPSVWQAACATITAWIMETSCDEPYGDNEHLVNTFYGNRPIYRGQSKTWEITPKAWRPEYKKIRALGNRPLEAYQKYLEEWVRQAKDFGLGLYENIASPHQVKATAQHYGFPTTLVDFTFNPLIALHFALGDSKPSADPQKNFGVIFTNSFNKLITSSHIALRTSRVAFPPIQVERLYRQSGFFVDFELDMDQKNGHADSWKLIEENCVRIIFPRTYPKITEGQELLMEWIEVSEPFFEDSLAGLLGYCVDTDEFDPQKAYVSALFGTKSRPPWYMEQDMDPEKFILIDKHLESIFDRLLIYLYYASCIRMQSGRHLDPLLIGISQQTNPAPFNSLHKFVEDGAFKTDSRFAKYNFKISESLQTYRTIVDRKLGPAKNSK